MMHPVIQLERAVRAAVAEAFGSEHASRDPLVHRSAFADFQADVALSLARLVRRPPLEVAGQIAERVKLNELCDEVRVSPPGFLNFSLRRDYLESIVSEIVVDPRCGVETVSNPETIVVDYSAPNVAKEMHVGHLRPTGIGDAIVRLLSFSGHRVIRQNHIGDWGTPFGMLIEHGIDQRTQGGLSDLQVAALNDFYKNAREKFDQDPGFAQRARQRVVLLQQGDASTLLLWEGLVSVSRRYFGEVYDKFGALLVDQDVRGESFYNPFLSEVVAELEQKGLARVDQGALCVFSPNFVGREGEPLPLIVRKSDGGYGYATTDLAALRYRTQVLGATRVLYVVGAPQQQHFAMVFEAAQRAGWLDRARAEHVSFGSVLGPDRKMLRTRSGDSVKLVDLLDEAIERASVAVRQKNPEMPAELVQQTARSVGVGAIKYADLSTERTKDYVFDWARMLSFEGNTGPYLQYAHARIQSILRRAGVEGWVGAPVHAGSELPSLRLEHPSERALGIELVELSTAVRSSTTTFHPHRLSAYLYELATRFSTFFESCPVLKAESPALRESRLYLSQATGRALALGLDLLGIQAPDRM